MKQVLKTHRSVQAILDAALTCFSQQGYRGTSIKDIAARAGISTGRVYHHFHAKIDIFTRLIHHYWSVLADPDLLFNQLVRQARFPDDIDALARAIKGIVEDNRESILLIYIDVIEFKGEHINRQYKNMAAAFRKAYGRRFAELKGDPRINPEADLNLAIMLVVRFFFHYFLVETSFGVQDHFGFSTDELIQKAREIFLHGILRGPEAEGSPA